MKITTSIEVPSQKMADWLVTAIEGGSPSTLPGFYDCDLTDIEFCWDEYLYSAE